MRRRMAMRVFYPGLPTRVDLRELKTMPGAKIEVGDKKVQSAQLLGTGDTNSVLAAYFEHPPTNAAGHNNYGVALAWDGKLLEAQEQFKAAGKGAVPTANANLLAQALKEA